MSADQEFADFFALCKIYEKTIKSDEYEPSTDLLQKLSLSDYGKSVFTRLQDAEKDLDAIQIMSILFMEMYWSELFFTANTENIILLENEISRNLQSELIRLPWVYGGELYRKFSFSFINMVDRLNSADTQSLLRETPQGVFQYRTYVTGPFGLQKSLEMRNHASQIRIPLSHCTDPSCSAIHFAVLTDNYSKNPSRKYLWELLSEDQQDSKNLEHKYKELDGESDYYDDRNASGIISFLGDCFDASELRLIATDLLSESNGLRHHLSNLKTFARLAGSATQIASQLSAAQCLQVILLGSDKMIAASLDRLIAADTIKVPASEIRSAKLANNSVQGWHQVKLEASCYGIRLMSLRPGLPLARIKRLIRAVYSTDQDSKDLRWKLRYTTGDTLEQKLDTYLIENTPHAALSDHIFSSPDALEKAFSEIRLGYFELPKNTGEEKLLIKRMMWKLGFSVPAHPIKFDKLISNIEQLRQVNKNNVSRQSDILHRIRGEAANVFVELERFLGHALSFSCWMLTNDHYAETRFSYNLGLSSREMAEKLNAYQESLENAGRIEYSPEGKNPLFPLISGFRLLADYCRYLQTQKGKYERVPGAFPGYVGRDKVQIFPFKHTKLFLDFSEKTKTFLLSELADVSVTLDRLKVANVRNRIEHNREDFPDQKEIEILLDGLVNLINRMQSSGLAPLSYVQVGMKQDQWGRGSVAFENYLGQEISLPVQVELDSCNLPDDGYIIIVPSVTFGNSQELVRFRIQQPSKYQDLWQGFPIRNFDRLND